MRSGKSSRCRRRRLYQRIREFCVDSVALRRNASEFQNAPLKFLRRNTLSGGGARQPRDVFFEQGSAVVVGARLQAELREFVIELDPRNLNVIDGSSKHDTRQGVHLEMLLDGCAGTSQALVKQECVLMDKS